MSFETASNHRVMTRDFIILALGLLALFLTGLGYHSYIVPSEARYIEIPREMAATGDWITPHLNGVKYFEKPPLFYWIQAAQIKFFGLGEFSGRFWTAIMMLGICMLTFVAATKKYGRRTGILSALILASSVLGFVSSRIAMLDVPVSFFLTICLFAFMFAAEMPPSRKRDGLLAIMYGAAALATLTKGLIGILIPAMIIGSWIALSNRWKLLLSVRLILGLVLFLLIAAPWHILAGQITPEFYHFYFIHEHFERFLTDSHQRDKPGWFFFAVLAVGMLPWTVFLWQSFSGRIKQAWADRKADGSDFYMLLWVVLPFTFFSLSHSKLVPYILPIFPIIAIFMARYLVAQWEAAQAKGFKIGVYAMAGLYMIIALAFPVLLFSNDEIATMIQPVRLSATLLSAMLLLQSVVLIVLMRRAKSASFITKAMVVFALAFVSFTAHVAPDVQTRSAQNSAKEYAFYLKPILKKDDEVAVFIHYFQDLPVYIDRKVTVVDVFGEMSFGRSIDESTHNRLIDRESFLKRWIAKDHRIYLMLRKTDFASQCPYYCHDSVTVLDLPGPNILVTNMPLDESIKNDL